MDFDFSLLLRQRKWDTLGCRSNADEYNFPPPLTFIQSLFCSFLYVPSFFPQQLTLFSNSSLFGLFQAFISLSVFLPFITFPHSLVFHRSFLLLHTYFYFLCVSCHSVCLMVHRLSKQLCCFCCCVVTVASTVCWSWCGFDWNCLVSMGVYGNVCMCVCLTALLVNLMGLIPGLIEKNRKKISAWTGQG